MALDNRITLLEDRLGFINFLLSENDSSISNLAPEKRNSLAAIAFTLSLAAQHCGTEFVKGRMTGKLVLPEICALDDEQFPQVRLRFMVSEILKLNGDKKLAAFLKNRRWDLDKEDFHLSGNEVRRDMLALASALRSELGMPPLEREHD